MKIKARGLINEEWYDMDISEEIFTFLKNNREMHFDGDDNVHASLSTTTSFKWKER